MPSLLRIPWISRGWTPAADLGLIPGLGRSAGEGIGYPLQFSWTFVLVPIFNLGAGVSLVVQLIKNPPAMQETPVPFLSWEDLLEKG